MHSTIKFRGKRIDNDEWVYGIPFFVKGESKCFIINNCQSINLTSSDSTFTGVAVYLDSVSQYIGLKDKNGLHIYENDIIRFYNPSIRAEYDNQICVVKFGRSRYYAKPLSNFRIIELRGFENRILCEGNEEITVIGNIHDNPELLTS